MCKLRLVSSFSFQDFVVGLYQSVGMPAGAKFSPEDVRLLYSKVFHVPSNTSEAQTAIKKVTTQTHFKQQHYQSGFMREQSVAVSVSDCRR